MSDLTTTIEHIAHILLEKKWRIATAESCTGGMVSAAFTEISGSSNWFERSYVTYSNEAKTEDLDVPSKMISEYGAVSIQVAESMAIGLLKKNNVDFALSITGVAGPTGDSPNKPVGHVCFAWAWQTPEGIQCQSTVQNFLGSNMKVTEKTRHDIRCQARDFAIHGALERLKR